MQVEGLNIYPANVPLQFDDTYSCVNIPATDGNKA
jgi:hypothetical protein